MVILEGVGTGVWLVWRGLITKSLSWKTLLVYVICVLICVLIYIIDTDRYVYVVEDDD